MAMARGNGAQARGGQRFSRGGSAGGGRNLMARAAGFNARQAAKAAGPKRGGRGGGGGGG